VLSNGQDLVEPPGDLFIAQRRKALALWLTRPDNPLTARVMANRLWQWHFGRGIVATANDFGRQGEPPTHPELLDWLATEFVARGWSLKAMHRLIMLSNTYQMSSAPDAANSKIDAENKYLWRMNRQRLDAESLRDAVLAASGALNLKMNGPPVVLPLSLEQLSNLRDYDTQWPVTSDPEEHNRRSVYLFVKRSYPHPMLATFDLPSTTLSCARRETTTVAPQALALVNSDFMLAQSERFAARLVKEFGAEPGTWIEGAFAIALGRSPSPPEKQKALEFLASRPETKLARFCQVLLNMNEFVYVD
jgi:hypothetical protein